jgi:hypothetical protein
VAEAFGAGVQLGNLRDKEHAPSWAATGDRIELVAEQHSLPACVVSEGMGLDTKQSTAVAKNEDVSPADSADQDMLHAKRLRWQETRLNRG